MLNGSGDDDRLDGDDGRDVLHGDGGNDRLFGEADSEQVTTVPPADIGNRFGDQLFGDDGDDRLDGGRGNDILNGGDGDDHLAGRFDNDLYLFTEDAATPNQTDRVEERSSEGTDTLDFSGVLTEYGAVTSYATFTNAGVVVDLAAAEATLEGGIARTAKQLIKTISATNDGQQFERVLGTTSHDFLAGSRLDDRLEGGLGNDVLMSSPGQDELVGGRGDDLYAFREFSPASSGPRGIQDVRVIENSGEGIDDSSFELIATSHSGPREGTTRNGVYLNLGPANGKPTPSGGRHNNLFISGPGLAEIENVSGTTFDDTIVGNSLGNNLFGRGGDDRLIGEDGDDWLTGNDGHDWLVGGDYDDLLEGGAGDDTLIGGSEIRSSAPNDDGTNTLTGGGGADLFTGLGATDFQASVKMTMTAPQRLESGSNAEVEVTLSNLGPDKVEVDSVIINEPTDLLILPDKYAFSGVQLKPGSLTSSFQLLGFETGTATLNAVGKLDVGSGMLAGDEESVTIEIVNSTNPKPLDFHTPGNATDTIHSFDGEEIVFTRLDPSIGLAPFAYSMNVDTEMIRPLNIHLRGMNPTKIFHGAIVESFRCIQVPHPTIPNMRDLEKISLPAQDYSFNLSTLGFTSYTQDLKWAYFVSESAWGYREIRQSKSAASCASEGQLSTGTTFENVLVGFEPTINTHGDQWIWRVPIAPSVDDDEGHGAKVEKFAELGDLPAAARILDLSSNGGRLLFRYDDPATNGPDFYVTTGGGLGTRLSVDYDDGLPGPTQLDENMAVKLSPDGALVAIHAIEFGSGKVSVMSSSGGNRRYLRMPVDLWEDLAGGDTATLAGFTPDSSHLVVHTPSITRSSNTWLVSTANLNVLRPRFCDAASENELSPDGDQYAFTGLVGRGGVATETKQKADLSIKQFGFDGTEHDEIGVSEFALSVELDPDRRPDVELPNEIGASATFEIRVKNIGETAGTFIVQAEFPEFDAQIPTAISASILAGGRDIFLQVRNFEGRRGEGGYRTRVLEPGESEVLTLELKVLNRAQPLSRRELRFRVQSGLGCPAYQTRDTGEDVFTADYQIFLAKTDIGLVVNTAGDQEDPDLSDLVNDVDLTTPGHQGTLRAAIEQHNHNIRLLSRNGPYEFARPILFSPSLSGDSTLFIKQSLSEILSPVVIDALELNRAATVTLDCRESGNGLNVVTDPWEFTQPDELSYVRGVTIRNCNHGIRFGTADLFDFDGPAPNDQLVLQQVSFVDNVRYGLLA